MAEWKLGAPYQVHFELDDTHNNFVSWLWLRGFELRRRPDLDGTGNVAVFDLIPGERFEPMEVEDWLDYKARHPGPSVVQ